MITCLKTRIQYLNETAWFANTTNLTQMQGVGCEGRSGAAAAADEEEEEEEATNKMHAHEKHHESLFRRLPRSTSHRFCE